MKNFKENCKLITDYLGLESYTIFMRSRQIKVVYPRQIIIYYYHVIKGYPIAKILLQFDCVQRTSAYNSIKAINNQMIYKNDKAEIIDILLKLSNSDYAKELKIINNLPKT